MGLKFMILKWPVRGRESVAESEKLQNESLLMAE